MDAKMAYYMTVHSDKIDIRVFTPLMEASRASSQEIAAKAVQLQDGNIFVITNFMQPNESRAIMTRDELTSKYTPVANMLVQYDPRAVPAYKEPQPAKEAPVKPDNTPPVHTHTESRSH